MKYLAIFVALILVSYAKCRPQNITQMIDDLSPSAPDVYESDNDVTTLLDMDNDSEELAPSLLMVACGYALATILRNV